MKKTIEIDGVSVTPKPKKLQVWHVPQVPGEPFNVPVSSVEDGVKLMEILADYDLFQFQNRIKPDYANASGLNQWNEESGEWESWYDEETSIDEPEEYLVYLYARNLSHRR